MSAKALSVSKWVFARSNWQRVNTWQTSFASTHSRSPNCKTTLCCSKQTQSISSAATILTSTPSCQKQSGSTPTPRLTNCSKNATTKWTTSLPQSDHSLHCPKRISTYLKKWWRRYIPLCMTRHLEINSFFTLTRIASRKASANWSPWNTWILACLQSSRGGFPKRSSKRANRLNSPISINRARTTRWRTSANEPSSSATLSSVLVTLSKS